MEQNIPRIRLKSIEEYHLILKYREDPKSVSGIDSDSPNPKSEPKPFVLSAWNYDTGKMMDIEEYCLHYGLNRDDIKEFRLITHTGTPFYNTLFKSHLDERNTLTEEFIESVVKKHVTPVDVSIDSHQEDGEWFDRCVYTDCHNGMETNKDGIAMYATKWDMTEQTMRVHIMVDTILANKKGNTLYLDDLGDFQDGWDGQTVRGGHSLPQNKRTTQAFDDGVALKMLMIDRLVNHYEYIHVNNICNDNHAGNFGYVTNSAVKMIVELKYPNVKVHNHKQFINHYFVGRHAFVITHGKDDKTLKFGFKPKLDAVQIEKIDAYLKNFGIYQKADYIEFGKGDSHQMLLDYCTSDDFNYFNYPAFAPSSEWVQNNFKKGRSGFVVQNVKYNDNTKNIIPKFF